MRPKAGDLASPSAFKIRRLKTPELSRESFGTSAVATFG
jgi:hypothetical protein